jgi:hypothetical protein
LIVHGFVCTPEAETLPGNLTLEQLIPVHDDTVSSRRSSPAKARTGPNINAAVAPAVAMISAEALQAAGLDGTAKHGGEVDKVVADALGHGAAPTVDGLLQAITGQGGGGQLAAISHVASPAADAVPAWDMGGHGAFVPGADMMFKMGAEMLHHDAVQPVANG